MNSFKSKLVEHALQHEEKIDIIFELMCLLAEDRKPFEYEKVREKWNKKARKR